MRSTGLEGRKPPGCGALAGDRMPPVNGGGMEIDMKYGDPGLKSFYLLEILTQRTDESHPLSTPQLAQILENEYQISLNRATIYSEIRKITDAGVDIVRSEGRPSGYYICARKFASSHLANDTTNILYSINLCFEVVMLIFLLEIIHL